VKKEHEMTGLDQDLLRMDTGQLLSEIKSYNTCTSEMFRSRTMLISARTVVSSA